MSKLHNKRLLNVGLIVLGVGVSVACLLYALSKNINLFYTPTQLLSEKIPATQIVRIGGMVVNNSIERQADLNVRFKITDFENEIAIKYRGILPDLFREGQGVVMLGNYNDGIFTANQVLAKHDEKYMPPELANLNKKQLTKTLVTN